MPIGSETHTGAISYEVVVQHNPTEHRLAITVEPFRVDGTNPTEAAKDQIFQTFLNKISELANTSIISATKKGKFTAPVTPA